jgi:hypothetical protein
MRWEAVLEACAIARRKEREPYTRNELGNLRWETVRRGGISGEETRVSWWKEVIMRQAILVLSL